MDDIRQRALALAPLISAVRRDLHHHPETAWAEYRTAAMAARHLSDLGYEVTMGADAVRAEARLDPPSPDVCALERRRAMDEGADPHLVARMGAGLTGLWADMRCPHAGAEAGPVVALRFDMDANGGITECAAPDHPPARAGFASVREKVMHACGHDGHTAIGMGTAAILASLRPQLRGVVRFIFQPAEEGGQGALPMLEAGALDGVDRLVGLHLGVQAGEVGEVVCGATHFLATTSFEMIFEGRPAHAGLAPQEGRNALLAACAAAQAMHGIPRHSEGASRVNVGLLQAGGASNIIPDLARLVGETRGETTRIDAFMAGEAARMAEAAARMWDCGWRMRRLSACPSGASSPELAALTAEVARGMEGLTRVAERREFWASEDFTWFLNRVQEQGGQGTYIQLGAGHVSGHHTDRFDFDEAALPLGVELLAKLAVACLSPGM